MEARDRCPYCGEDVELWIDQSAGSMQRYVEDCPICCRPWNVAVVVAEDGARVTLERQDA